MAECHEIRVVTQARAPKAERPSVDLEALRKPVEDAKAALDKAQAEAKDAYRAALAPDRERPRLVAQALAGTAVAGKKDNGPKQTVATRAAERAALKKLVANWRALIDQRLAGDEGTLFDTRRGIQ